VNGIGIGNKWQTPELWLAGFPCGPRIFHVQLSLVIGGREMEIVLALIIGCAVASVVFVLGRAFVGSESASDTLQQLPPFLHSDNASAAVSDTVVTIDQTAKAHGAEPLPEQAIEAPKRGRKKSSAMKTASSSRRRKRPGTATPRVNVVQ
jgi:hypothetical protein